MKIDIHKFLQVYKKEYKKAKRKMGIKFMIPIFTIMLLYSIGLDKYGDKAIYHVFMIGLCSIICACWINKNNSGDDE